MKRIRFGTDGWRAIIAEDYTYENVRYCAAGVATYLETAGLAGRGLVLGYDTRFASEHFAAAVAEVIGARGITVWLADRPAPTPVISYNLLARAAGGGIVITSSHNPATYNGFKYKPDYAGSASPEVVAELEAAIDAAQDRGSVERRPLADLLAAGVVRRIDPREAYLDQIERLVDLPALRAAGLRIGVDSMYGAGAGYFRALLEGGATQVVEINAERNPAFPGIQAPEPIARNLERFMVLVPRERLGVGLATDGDADRLGIVDERGGFVTQLQVFALLVLYMLEVRGERGPIVRSLTTSVMADRLAEQYGVPIHETNVGFKYVGPLMMSQGAIIGGEESGGYGFKGHIPERDGILAGLYFVDLMMRLGKTPTELIDYLYERVGPHYYDRIDLGFPPEERDAILQRVASAHPTSLDGIAVTGIRTTDGFRFALGKHGWLLIRFSGTEPVLRIYCETDSPERVRRLLDAGRALAGVEAT